MTGTRLPSSKPLRVLFVNDHLGFSGGVIHGSTTYLTNTLPAFDPNRILASLAILRPCHPAAERLSKLGVRVRFFNRASWDLRAFWDIVKLIDEWGIDLLHVNGKQAHFLGRLAGRWTGTRARGLQRIEGRRFRASCPRDPHQDSRRTLPS